MSLQHLYNTQSPSIGHVVGVVSVVVFLERKNNV